MSTSSLSSFVNFVHAPPRDFYLTFASVVRSIHIHLPYLRAQMRLIALDESIRCTYYTYLYIHLISLIDLQIHTHA